MNKTDLIIIGSGPGGYRAAEYAAKNGLQVVIVESAFAGGTCLNCGCIPTKAFCHDAELAEIRQSFDFQQVVERKQQIVEQLRSGVESLMQQPGITFVHGHGHFKDANTVEVVSTVYPEGGGEPETLVQEFKADNIIIATGSRTKILPIPGITGPNCITSTELLDIQQVPKRLCIIGAGVIGMEFASVFASFGSEVTVVEYLKECLPAMDSDIAKRLRKQLEKRGVKFYLGAGVKKVDGCTVAFERKGKEESIEADVILVATGRTPNIENLNLDQAGIAYDRLGIKVNPDTFEVVQQGGGECRVFAIGDVNGRQLLAHAATMQGIRVVNTILGRKDAIRLDVMPAAVFTSPEAASVGPTEDHLKDEGREYTCHKGYYRSNGKALAIDATEGIVKLFTDASDRIIGCHILGA
ncbi:MAG: NAD(P)/FAD-dependent oxidoreductase, partial [Prevotella sp.]|nr:NAD(P)/FAD-dependent oxidoreductase [Prevotella sp.]